MEGVPGSSPGVSSRGWRGDGRPPPVDGEWCSWQAREVLDLEARVRVLTPQLGRGETAVSPRHGNARAVENGVTGSTTPSEGVSPGSNPGSPASPAGGPRHVARVREATNKFNRGHIRRGHGGLTESGKAPGCYLEAALLGKSAGVRSLHPPLPGGVKRQEEGWQRGLLSPVGNRWGRSMRPRRFESSTFRWAAGYVPRPRARALKSRGCSSVR